MRAKVDDLTFDLREYLQAEVKGLQFENYAVAWIARREREVERGHLSREYLRTTRVYVHRYMIPFFGKRNLRDIQEGAIEDFRDQLPTHLRAKTVYNILGILQKMLTDAHRRRDINRLPAFPTISVPDPETKWIGRKDQERILAQIQDPVRRAFFLFLMETGCRPGEARALKWERVQLKIGKVVIAAAMDQGNYKEHTKEGDVRIIPLCPELNRTLASMPKGTPGGFVFTFRGKPFSYKLIWRTWRKAALSNPTPSANNHLP
jgi:integrase